MYQSKRSLKLQKKSRKPLLFLFASILFLLVPVSAYYYVYHIYFGGKVISPISTKVLRFAPSDPTQSVKDELKSTKITYSDVSIATDSGYIVDLPEGSEVLLSKDKNVHEQVVSLQVILQRLTIEGKAIKRLDLRFDKPVIELK